MTGLKPLASAKNHVRCGTPDCDWGAPLSSFDASQVDECLRQFREHCIERHGVDPNDAARFALFNLEALTLTLLDDYWTANR
jgi:hypothetical protein